jgi:hypothetical protein
VLAFGYAGILVDVAILELDLEYLAGGVVADRDEVGRGDSRKLHTSLRGSTNAHERA